MNQVMHNDGYGLNVEDQKSRNAGMSQHMPPTERPFPGDLYFKPHTDPILAPKLTPFHGRPSLLLVGS